MPPEDQELTAPAVSAEDARAEVERLKRKNKELLDEKARLKERVIPEGVDVDELLRFKRETELKAAEAAGDYATAKQQWEQQYKTDTEALRAENASLKARIRELELITPAASVLAGLVHEPDDVFKTGRLRPEMIEPSADGPVVVDGLARVPLAEWAKQKLPAYMLKAPKPVGSGAPAGGGGSVAGDVVAGMKNPFTREHFNLGEQQRLFDSNPSMYQQLLAAAKAQLGRG